MLALVALAIACLAAPAAAQSVAGRAEHRIHPLQPPDTSSPRATLQTFFDSVALGARALKTARASHKQEPGLAPSEDVQARADEAEFFIVRAMGTLDISWVPPAAQGGVALEATFMLKEVLDRVVLPPTEEIPDAAAVEAEGITRWRLPNTSIVIARVADGPRAGEFLFSSETVEQVPRFYEKIRDLPYITTGTEGNYEFYATSPGRLLPPKWLIWVEDLPHWMRTPVYGQTVWQWLGMVLVGLLCLLLPYATRRWKRRRLASLGSPARDWLRLSVPVVALIALRLFVDIADQQLNITGEVLNLTATIVVVTAFAVLAWIAYLVAHAIAETLVASPRIDKGSLDASMLRMGFRVLGALAAIAMLFVGADRLGIPLVTLLAGLGVGGFAVALAARPTLENLIGGIILFADRPVRVGDFCSFGNKMGTIENIGMRSTQIRALDRTVISVPNAQFVDMELVNWARCDRMMIETVLRLRYETTPEQLRFVLAKLREMLVAHPMLGDESWHVRLIGLGESSFDVRLRVYATTSDWPTFFGIQEDVLLRVIDIVEGSGTGFALPSQTVYLGRDGVLDTAQQAADETEVESWRAAGELPFPDLSDAARQRLRNTIGYPPPGSPAAAGKPAARLAGDGAVAPEPAPGRE